jgi:hypothetical protein
MGELLRLESMRVFLLAMERVPPFQISSFFTFFNEGGPIGYMQPAGAHWYPKVLNREGPNLTVENVSICKAPILYIIYSHDFTLVKIYL